MSGPLLSLRWAGAPVAVPLAGVREILRHRDVVPVPGAAPPVVGLIDVRGTPLRVLDLRRVATGHIPPADGAPEQLPGRDVLIIDDVSGNRLGLLCDEVLGVGAEGIPAPVPGLPGYVTGVLPGPVPVLDLAALLAVAGG